MNGTVRILRGAAIAGFADYRALYTLRSWVMGWLARVISQVIFFGMIGHMIGDRNGQYVLIGSAVGVAALESCMAVSSTTWERRAGTLPLLVSAPANQFLVFLGRSVQWIASGTVTSCVALFGLAPFFGVVIPMDAVPLIVLAVLLVSVSTYCFALVLAAAVLGFVSLRNVAANVGYLALMVFSGVQVPVDFWPWPIQATVSVLPLTHGLSAVRGLIAGADMLEVGASMGRELIVGLVWLFVARAAFSMFVRVGRRTGSIEFAD